jgi:multidrug transporter EmrE-like cation transporter
VVTAYAIWSGLGIIFTAPPGVIRQSPDLPAAIGPTLIVAGVVVVKGFLPVDRSLHKKHGRQQRRISCR